MTRHDDERLNGAQNAELESASRIWMLGGMMVLVVGRRVCGLAARRIPLTANARGVGAIVAPIVPLCAR
jgi:hypothetical protein